MDKKEIIRRLRNIANHAVYREGEGTFSLSLDDGIALCEAAEMLEAETGMTGKQLREYCRKRNLTLITCESFEVLKAYYDRQNCDAKTGKWLKTGQSFVLPDKFRNYFCSECGFEIEKTTYNILRHPAGRMGGRFRERKKNIGTLL